MPLYPEYSSIRANPRGIIPLRSKVAHRFYEPIVLLDGLNTTLKSNRASNSPDLSLDTAQSPERAFHCFVNKLGQLCDSKRGGSTVTAFVVLKFPDRIQYRFASNQQAKKDLICTRAFIFHIIQTLGGADNDELHNRTTHILRESLSFARPRVENYVKSLKKYAALCSGVCASEDTDESMSILKRLQELQALLHFSDDTELNNNAFSQHCEPLINAIDRLYSSEVDELIRNRTNEDRMNESELWCELRHGAGRLLSYLQAAKVLISTRKRWPELFESFEVRFISSSSPDQYPLPSYHRKGGLSAYDIIGRMTSDHEAKARYRAHAQELEQIGLDDYIRQKIFRPIVHAEILLLESLERDYGTHPSLFFNNYKYIGCSKPTCRLCDYYFSFHASGIEVRPTHRNLYPRWRMPDVREDQGLVAIKKREDLINKILIRIREDTFRALTEKVSERKNHDSNTDPTYPIDSIPDQEPQDIEQLRIGFQDFDIGYSGDEAITHSSSRASFNTSDFFVPESEDEDDGGAKI